MKPFNFRNPGTQKWFLVSGLLIALGFNLSWNPENTHIARHETPMGIKVTEFASHKLEKIELQKDFSSLCDVTILFSTPEESATTLKFRVEGEVCETCEHNFEVPIQSTELADIKMILADQADKFCPKKADHTKDNDTEDNAELAEVKNQCEDLTLEDGDDITDCSDALIAMADSCDAMDPESKEERKARTACKRSVEKAFKDYLKPLLQQGLQAKMNSPEYQAIRSVRNDLVSELPSIFDGSLRTQLVSLTAYGVAYRAASVFSLCSTDPSACPQGAIPDVMARTQMQNERAWETKDLRNVVNQAYSLDNSGARVSSMEQMLAQNFAQPLNSLFVDQNPGTAWDMGALQDKMLAGMLGLDPNAASTATEAIAGARENYRAIEIDPNLFQPFGTAVEGGVPAILKEHPVAPTSRVSGRKLDSVSNAIPMPRPGT